MWGDASDNIPGIPGIGEKTAKKLIQQYGSMENMIAHSHELKGKMKENVEAFVDQAHISKMLATIILDVPIEVSDDDFNAITGGDASGFNFDAVIDADSDIATKPAKLSAEQQSEIEADDDYLDRKLQAIQQQAAELESQIMNEPPVE
jgi:5'-3' exonuclease